MGPEAKPPITPTKIVVATTVALSFISFWRGAAVVLADLASSSFYAGGIAERAVGPAAPWLVLGVMFFSFAVRSVYMESCGMFVRGGVYVVVRDSMGPFLARLSVSSLVFDYILTGPISSVTAGQYLARLLLELSEKLHHGFQTEAARETFAAGFATTFAVLVTLYFWWSNTKGIQESSGKALRIMQAMTVMVVILLLWCPITLLVHPSVQTPPAPTPANLKFNEESLGWFWGTFWPQVSFVAIVIAFGHAFLSMSGFETLAQIYREIGYPKMRNLKLAANLVCGYAVISTGVVTVFAGMIIPAAVRGRYVDNLIGGLAEHLAGPPLLKLCFHVFVVMVGTLILSGAVNTAIIGANGVLNRVAEDGVLLDWFRKPHRRFGTTYRIINLIAALQIVTILASRGDVYLLGEAYAFGVVWSFLLKALGVLVLRFQRRDQEYKTPFNLRIGGRELPVGLALTTLVLAFIAVANLFSKRIATIWGVAFTLVVFAVFTLSERINARKQAADKSLEKFNLDHQPQIDADTLRARPGCVLVAIRDYTRMEHLKRVLLKTNLRRHDIVVMTVRQFSAGAGEHGLSDDQLFSGYEQELFSHVVSLAEKEGKPVELLVAPAVNAFDAMVQAAARLQASRLVTGVSASMASEELARRIGLAWERLPEPRHAFSLEVISPDRPPIYVNLGPHPPRLWPEDLDRLHEMWLRLSERFGARLHHRDVAGIALRRLERDLGGAERGQVLEEFERDLGK